MTKLVDRVQRVVKRRVAKVTEPEPNRPKRMMQVAIGFAGNDGLAPKVGDKYPEDHPLVKKYGWAFTPAELGDAYARDFREKYAVETERAAIEGMQKRDAALRAAEEQFKPKKPEPTPLSRQRLCIRHAGAFGGLGADRAKAVQAAGDPPWRDRRRARGAGQRLP